MRIIRLEVEKEKEKELKIIISKGNKFRPIYQLIVKVDEEKYHNCERCVFSKCCQRECDKLEETKIIWDYCSQKFGIYFFDLTLTPISLSRK